MLFYIELQERVTVIFVYFIACLQSEENEECDHQAEETHGFREGESKNGVREELSLQRWISGVTDDQGAEHGSDT